MTVTARRNRLLVAVLVALTMTAGIFGAAVLTARAAQADPVYLEPASAAGADPFVPSLLQPQEGAAAVPEMAGTGDQGTCDPATLTAYLNGHPDAAAAWVKALDADPGLSWSGGKQVTVEQISAYVGELTPAVLGGDMQVTNHRFVDGQLAAVQSVLQEGTAVLVDADGTPRVRCACGNPLTPAADSDDESSETEYVGEPWDGFTYEDSTEDSQASDDEDGNSSDHPVVDCKRGEYRDGDHCVRHCPRGSYRDDDGRCRPPIDHCDRDKHKWCEPRPGCTPPQKPHAEESAASTTERHGPPCRPDCSDRDRSGASAKHCAPPCPSAEGTAERRHCTPPPSLPCPIGKACPADPPTCPVSVTDVVATKTGPAVDPCAVLPGGHDKPEKSAKTGAEGTPDTPDSPPAGRTEGSTDPAGDPKVTLPGLPPANGGKEGGPVVDLPPVVSSLLPPASEPAPAGTPAEAKPPVALPAPLPDVVPPAVANAVAPAPAESKPAVPATPAPVEAKPLPAVPLPAIAPARSRTGRQAGGACAGGQAGGACAAAKPAAPAPAVKPAAPAPAVKPAAPAPAVKPAVPAPAVKPAPAPAAKPVPPVTSLVPKSYRRSRSPARTARPCRPPAARSRRPGYPRAGWCAAPRCSRRRPEPRPVPRCRRATSTPWWRGRGFPACQ